jgi:cytosine/adenosine deaminase-related metal-dependent hydrolase
VADGWIASVDGRIQEVGSGTPPGPSVDLGDVAILPGLVNAHTHLELSWMAGRVAQAPSMTDWIRNLLRIRAAGPTGGDAEVRAAMTSAALALRAFGTVLVGDVSNTLQSSQAIEAAGLGGVVFHELLGFDDPDPARTVRAAWQRVAKLGPALRYAVVAHAPYSVSPGLFREIARQAGDAPLAVHLAESADEVELLRTGRGPFRRLLEDLEVWNPAWRPPGDPVSYLANVGYLQRGMLAVHGVQLDEAGLGRLNRAGAVVVTCPRSNRWVGAGIPRVGHFYAARIPVAIGTDSLASAPTLSLFDELAELRRVAPEVSAAMLLDSATRAGAEALGFGHQYGTLTPGKRAALVAVDVPAGMRDVEEYLVGGVAPEAVRRVL